MTRSRAAAGLLLAVAALAAAGCGASRSAESVALGAARQWGGSKPRVVETERVLLANGDATDVVLIRARFCGGNDVSGVSTAGRPGPCGATLGEFLWRPGAGGADGYLVGMPRGQWATIARARQARRFFDAFPDLPDLLVRCPVPPGLSPAGRTHGLCQTRVSPGRVAFVAGWPASKPAGTRHVAGWVVRLGADGHVLGVQLHRERPVDSWIDPQNWLRHEAHAQAVRLEEPHPTRIRVLLDVPSRIARGRVDAIELWGRFANHRPCPPVLATGKASPTCTRPFGYVRVEYSAANPAHELAFEGRWRPPRDS